MNLYLKVKQHQHTLFNILFSPISEHAIQQCDHRLFMLYYPLMPMLEDCFLATAMLLFLTFELLSLVLSFIIWWPMLLVSLSEILERLSRVTLLELFNYLPSMLSFWRRRSMQWRPIAICLLTELLYTFSEILNLMTSLITVFCFFTSGIRFDDRVDD